MSGFPFMKIREENYNMILLTVVTVFTVTLAGSATLMKRASARIAESRLVQLAADQTPSQATERRPVVRVIGVPFTPNTNPRER